MKKTLLILVAATMMTACGQNGSPTSPTTTRNPRLEPGPPVFDPGNMPTGR